MIQLGAKNNRVGSNADGKSDDDERNLISGNTTSGVSIRHAGTSQNTVAGNDIGVNDPGNSALPNGLYGVEIYGGATANLIGGSSAAIRNIISGNASHGVVLIDPDTEDNKVQGNYIGLRDNGVDPIGNGGIGVFLLFGASSNFVGTDGNNDNDATEGNVISANGSNGVDLFRADTQDNVIAGNLIGTDWTGTLDRGNTFNGIFINRAQGTRIGTDGNGVGDDVEGNVISGNSNGIIVNGDRELIDSIQDADALIAGTITSRTVVGPVSISRADLRDADGPAGNWSEDNAIPGGGGR